MGADVWYDGNYPGGLKRKSVFCASTYRCRQTTGHDSLTTTGRKLFCRVPPGQGNCGRFFAFTERLL